MNKQEINAILKEFDNYIERTLSKKDQSVEIVQPQNEMDLYYECMKKRLKFKAVSNDEKFQNKIAPMKKLKTFVSIKEFVDNLSIKGQKIQSEIGPDAQSKSGQNYQLMKRAAYMNKIQAHLRQKKLKRKLDDQAQMLLLHLQGESLKKSQYRTWIEGTLEKINMKQETMTVKPSQFIVPDVRQSTKYKSRKCSFQNVKPQIDCKQIKKENHQKRLQDQNQQKRFKQVSDYLSSRLKKTLTDKYVSVGSKQILKNKDKMKETADDLMQKSLIKFDINLQSANPFDRRVKCRTSDTSGRFTRQSSGSNAYRVKTSQIKKRRPFGDIQANRLTMKMNNFLASVDNVYNNSIQEKKVIKEKLNLLKTQKQIMY